MPSHYPGVVRGEGTCHGCRSLNSRAASCALNRVHRAYHPDDSHPEGQGSDCLRTFAARYPDQVAGMVLVDSTTAASAAKPWAASPSDAASYDVTGRVSALVSSSARLGVARLYGQADYGSLPPRSRTKVRANAATPSHVRSTIEEYVQASASMEQAAALRDFADSPLIVLAAGSGHNAAWSAAQNDMTTLSTNSVHRVIDCATHTSLIIDEKDAAATIQAILDVI